MVKKTEPLSLRIIDSHNVIFYITRQYRSSDLRFENDYNLLEQLNKISFTSGKSENIIIAGDFNLRLQ